MGVDPMVVNEDGPGEPAASLYAQIGGAGVVGMVVDRLYTMIGEDVALRSYFQHVDMVRLKRHMVMLLVQILGGPGRYEGRDLAEAHRSLGISGEHYQRVGDYLRAALLVVNAPREVVDTATEVLADQRAYVVTVPDPSASEGGDGSDEEAVVWPPEVG